MEKGKLHINHHYQNQPIKRQKPTKVEKKPMKIKYISSPIMVKAGNASEFRAIVQQLTGKNADPISPDDTYTMVTEEASHVPHQNTPHSMMGTDEEVNNKLISNTMFNEGDFWLDCNTNSLLEIPKHYFF